MSDTLELPELPEPSIRVTHETDTVYCADVPADQVPPHSNYWSEARVLAIRDSGIKYGMELAAETVYARAKWLPCDCGCPGKKVPQGSSDNALIRAAAAIRAKALTPPSQTVQPEPSSQSPGEPRPTPEQEAQEWARLQQAAGG